MIFDFVKGKVAVGLIIVAGLAIGGALLYHFTTVSALKLDISGKQVKINELEADKTKLVSDLKTAVDANKSLTEAINLQNGVIEAMRREAEERAENARKALEKARKEADKWKKRYDDILSQPAPVTDDPCGSTSILMQQYLELRQEEKK